MMLNKYRYFDNTKEPYELRFQPADKMHRDFVDLATIRHRHVAERIAKTRRARGEDVRIVKVAKGWRIYFRRRT